MTQTEALDLDAAEGRALSALAAWNGAEDVTHGEEERRVDAALRDLLPLVEELRRTNADLFVAVAEATQARNDRDAWQESAEDFASRLAATEDERDEARAAVEAVRALHRRVRQTNGDVCDVCLTYTSPMPMPAPWPCRTVRVLGPVAETPEQPR